MERKKKLKIAIYTRKDLLENSFVLSAISILKKNNVSIYRFNVDNNFNYELNYDFVFSFGGDGTILGAISRLKNKTCKIFGIDMGTLGFLTSAKLQNMKACIQKILVGDYFLDRRMMIEMKMKNKSKLIAHDTALNDVVVSQRKIARLSKLDVFCNSKKVGTYIADGLIIATPTGATAYSLSAGGPLVHPTLDAFVITAICPHSLMQSPLVLSSDVILEITLSPTEKNDDVMVTLDGQRNFTLRKNSRLLIKKFSKKMQFVRMKRSSYFRTIRKKLGWGI